MQTFGTNEDEAKIMFHLDFGKNKLEDERVIVTKINLASPVNGNGVTIRNDDGIAIATNNTYDPVDIINDEIYDGDQYTFKVYDDLAEVKIAIKGFRFKVDGRYYISMNDRIIDL